MTDILIIGGGPAGLTAAIYTLRSGASVTLLEKTGVGGQAALADKIVNYPGFDSIAGYELAEKMHAQATGLGLTTVYAQADSIERTQTGFKIGADGDVYEAKSVIVATGASPRSLGIESKWLGRGVSYCATCDGAFFRGKPVAVVGGGNTALGDALYLSRIASKVYLIHRRDEYRAAAATVEEIERCDKVEKVLSSVPVSIDGDVSVKSVTVKNVNDGTERQIEVNGIFIAVGQTPESAVLRGLVKTDASGYVLTDGRCGTEVPGLFVAGDVRDTTLRQIVTACADGAIAAERAAEYVRSH